MASLMVSAVADSCEFLFAVATVIRLLTGMCTHVHEKIAFFGKDFSTVFYFALKEVLT